MKKTPIILAGFLFLIFIAKPTPAVVNQIEPRKFDVSSLCPDGQCQIPAIIKELSPSDMLYELSSSVATVHSVASGRVTGRFLAAPVNVFKKVLHRVRSRRAARCGR